MTINLPIRCRVGRTPPPVRIEIKFLWWPKILLSPECTHKQLKWLCVAAWKRHWNGKFWRSEKRFMDVDVARFEKKALTQ